jgi:hypothetical protein
MGLKVIFSKQLPNMPREYICRLLLDRRHRSCALVARNGQVLGGITYRVFPQQVNDVYGMSVTFAIRFAILSTRGTAAGNCRAGAGQHYVQGVPAAGEG